MQKLITLSPWIQRFILLLLIPSILIERVFSWSKINMNTLFITYHQNTFNIEQDISSLPLIGKLILFIIESFSTLLFLIAIWYFLKIIHEYKNGLLFSKKVIVSLKKINIVLLIWALYQLLFATFESLIISFFKPVGQRYITIAIGTHDIIHFFVLLIFFLIFYIIQEAYKIKLEQDLVV